MMKGLNLGKKLKSVAAVACLIAAASSANAAINDDNATSVGGGDLTGELFVSVFRNIAGNEQSYLLDTGITAAQLLAGSVANGTILGNVGSFFSTAPTSGFVFNAGAVANGGNPGEFGSIFTSSNSGAVQQLADLTDLGGIGSINGNMATFIDAANGAIGGSIANNDDLANISAGSPGYHARSDWGAFLGNTVTFSTEGSLDTALALWGVVINETFDGFTRVALGFLTAESGTGNIVYTTGANPSPVPVPAAVWLLGSALVGMAAVGRRRREGAAA